MDPEARASRLIMGLLLVVLPACTTGGTTGSTSPQPSCLADDPSCADVGVSVDGRSYRIECQPVAEALTDVVLGRDGGRPVRAIAGVSSTQGVAVLWRDPAGCGLFALALARDLSEDTAQLIRDEVARGVERFGVTASPIPREPAEDRPGLQLPAGN